MNEYQRGEFHFLSENEMSIIPSFKLSGYIPDTKAMYIYDETGQLELYLSERTFTGNFITISKKIYYNSFG